MTDTSSPDLAAAPEAAPADGPPVGPPARDPQRAHLRLMLTLTFATGIVDAVGFLGLDRVFTANMTGNVVILGMALTGADDLPVTGPALALVGFVLGAVLAGRALAGLTGAWSAVCTGLLCGVGTLVSGLGILLMLWADAPHPVLLGVTGALGLAMGAQAATARAIAVKDVTTVVITSTITGLAMDSRLAGGSGPLWARRLLAVALMLVGATVGALLLRVHVGAGLVLAGLICAVTALIGHRRGRV